MKHYPKERRTRSPEQGLFSSVMTKNYILKRIRNIAYRSMTKPRWGLSRGCFEQRSYAKAAVEELMREIKESDAPPHVVIENFMQKMDDYACLNSHTSYMFSIAYDMAKYILDSLVGIG